MKVLMTADAREEVWACVVELARALRPHGVSIVLAVIGPPLTPGQREPLADCPHVQLEEGRFRLEWMEDPWSDIGAAGNWLLRIEDRLRPDVVHLNQYVHAALPWHAPRIVVGHGCLLSRWAATRQQPIPPRYARYRDQVRRGLRAADLLITPTRAMARDLQAHYGPLPSVQVIAHGRGRAGFGGGMKEPILFTVGRLWDDARNILTLAKVAPHLKWPVYVAGEQTCPEPGGPAGYQQVRCLGALATEAVVTWLNRAALFVLPARYDPLGVTVLEAALARCVLVLGDIPSLRERWHDAALFVRPEDVGGLQALLGRLIADGHLRGDLADRAYRRAVEFPPAAMATAYMNAYHTVPSVLQPR